MCAMNVCTYMLMRTSAVVRLPPPLREKDRLRLLRECNILDTPPEESYDQFTSLTSRIFKVSYA